MDVKAASVTKRFGLSGNALKVIAIIAMTIDHVAWMRIEAYEQAEVPLQIFLHCIGRLTAPIMFFFVAEGYHHTRNFWKYVGRMALLAAVSHFAFCYSAGGAEQGELLQADALAHGGCHAVRYRVLQNK